jgi:hypothetical protein
MTVELSAPAAASSSGGTSRGTMAPRAGAFRPKQACCTASSSRTTHTDREPVNACSQNSIDVTAMPAFVTTSRVRRSTASATEPPQRPKTTSGTSATAPLTPTHADDPVSSKICLGTATAVSWLPMEVTTVEAHSRR